jgi:Family of unknown function (DUF6339)
MSLLYPRLLDRVARQLHNEYTKLPIAVLMQRSATYHKTTVFTATGGRRINHRELESLREGLLKIATDNGYPAGLTRQARSGFDTEAARYLHAHSGLVAGEAAVRDLWSFLALILLPDITYWRYPSPPVDRVLGTDITRHVLGRLWWRAHLLEDRSPGGDRYGLIETFGEAAFDQMFARRKSLGGSRSVVRCLARTWPTREFSGINERELLRDVLKRLLRIGAMVEFEALTEEQLTDEIGSAIDVAIRSLGNHSGGSVGGRHAADDIG